MENLPAERSYEGPDSTSNTKERRKLNTNRYLTYDVLRIVFKYLNGMELSKASVVCRSWLEVANDEKRIRRDPAYLVGNIKYGTNCFKSQLIEKLQIKPALGLFFKAPCKRYNKQDCYCKILPKSCKAITLGTCGILINDKEMENALDNVVSAFLPEIPNVTITVVTIINYSKDVLPYYNQLCMCGTTQSKCLLLFCNQRGRGMAKTLAELLQLCDKTVKPSVWGGVVKDLHVCNSESFMNSSCGQFAFCVGVFLEGSVESWSVVINHLFDTKELVEEKLKSFKNNVSLKKHSMGFMFACCERGESMFDECNVESSTFKKLFPDIPLVGCFGDGEFGETTKLLLKVISSGTTRYLPSF